MADSISYQIGGINNQITDDFGTDNDLEVTGGGRGWTATTTLRGEIISAKGTSKLGAAEALYDAVAAAAVRPATDDDEPEGEMELPAEFDGVCSLECMGSRSKYCDCRCEGANHGKGVGAAFVPVAIGPKPCACGCGEPTNRQFKAGHDARFHFAERARAAGMTVEAFRAKMKAARNEARKAKRAANKAADAAIATGEV